MKRKTRELARIARDILNNRYTLPMGAFVAAIFIPAVIEIPFSLYTGTSATTSQLVISGLAEFLILLIEQVLLVGVLMGQFNLTRNQPFSLKTIFTPFKITTDRYFGAAFLFDLMIALALCPGICCYLGFRRIGAGLPAVLLLLAGICCSTVLAALVLIHYLLVFCFLVDYPQMRVFDAYKECRRAMRGSRLRMLSVLVSLLGWFGLVICSFGIAALWAGPYMLELLTVFYLDITGELDRLPVRSYQT